MKLVVSWNGRLPGSSSRKPLLATPSVSPANASAYSAGSAGTTRGSPRASNVVGTVTTMARHSTVPRGVDTHTRSAFQSIAVTGHSSTTSSPWAALATTAPSPSATAQLISVSSLAAKSAVESSGVSTPNHQLMMASKSGRYSRSAGATPAPADAPPDAAAAPAASRASSP